MDLAARNNALSLAPIIILIWLMDSDGLSFWYGIARNLYYYEATPADAIKRPSDLVFRLGGGARNSGHYIR